MDRRSTGTDRGAPPVALLDDAGRTETNGSVEPGRSIPGWLAAVVGFGLAMALVALTRGGTEPVAAPAPGAVTAPADDDTDEAGSGAADGAGADPEADPTFRSRITDGAGAWSRLDPPTGTHRVAAVESGLVAVTGPGGVGPSLWRSEDGASWSPVSTAPDGTDRLDLVDGVATARGAPDALAVSTDPTGNGWQVLPTSSVAPGLPREIDAAARLADGTTMVAVANSNRFDAARWATLGLDLDGAPITCVARVLAETYALHDTPACSGRPTAIAVAPGPAATEAWLRTDERVTTTVWTLADGAEPVEWPLPEAIADRAIVELVPRSPTTVDVLTVDGGWVTVRIEPPAAIAIADPVGVGGNATAVPLGTVSGTEIGLGDAAPDAGTPYVRPPGEDWLPVMVPSAIEVGATAAVARSQPTDLGTTPITVDVGPLTVTVIPAMGRPLVARGGVVIDADLRRVGDGGWELGVDGDVVGTLNDDVWLAAARDAGYDPARGRLGLSGQLLYVTRDGITWLRSAVERLAGEPIHVYGATVSPTDVVIEANTAAVDLTGVLRPERRWYRLDLAPDRRPGNSAFQSRPETAPPVSR